MAVQQLLRTQKNMLKILAGDENGCFFAFFRDFDCHFWAKNVYRIWRFFDSFWFRTFQKVDEYRRPPSYLQKHAKFALRRDLHILYEISGTPWGAHAQPRFSEIGDLTILDPPESSGWEISPKFHFSHLRQSSPKSCPHRWEKSENFPIFSDFGQNRKFLTKFLKSSI